jgi:hypothetical protein
MRDGIFVKKHHKSLQQNRYSPTVLVVAQRYHYTQHNYIQHNDTQHNDIQHDGRVLLGYVSYSGCDENYHNDNLPKN